MTWLGVDLGGTNTKVALLDDDCSTVLERGSVPTDRSSPEAAVRRAAALAAEWANWHPTVRGVGATIPGHFDAEGRATVVPNIPGSWPGVPVQTVLADATRLPTVLVNDARAFGLAESRLGAARGAGRVVAVVLGTGVGGAVVLEHRLYAGSGGRAGEIGHMVLQADGPPCGCGNIGCLEALVRSDVLAAQAGAETVEDAVRRARAGDARAIAAIRAAARWLAIGLGNVATLLTPEAIVVGGGIAQAGDVLLGPLLEELDYRTPLLPAGSFRVVAAKLGPLAGAAGAATLAHDTAEDFSGRQDAGAAEPGANAVAGA